MQAHPERRYDRNAGVVGAPQGSPENGHGALDRVFRPEHPGHIGSAERPTPQGEQRDEPLRAERQDDLFRAFQQTKSAEQGQPHRLIAPGFTRFRTDRVREAPRTRRLTGHTIDAGHKQVLYDGPPQPA